MCLLLSIHTHTEKDKTQVAEKENNFGLFVPEAFADEMGSTPFVMRLIKSKCVQNW